MCCHVRRRTLPIHGEGQMASKARPLSPSWHRSHDLPASIPEVPGLQMYRPTPGTLRFYFKMGSPVTQSQVPSTARDDLDLLILLACVFRVLGLQACTTPSPLPELLFLPFEHWCTGSWVWTKEEFSVLRRILVIGCGNNMALLLWFFALFLRFKFWDDPSYLWGTDWRIRSSRSILAS